MSFRRTWLAALAATGLLALSNQGMAQTAKAIDLSGVTLNIGQNNGELEPLWRASGVFDGTPYKIEFSSFNNALDNYTALAAGNVDISSSALNTALQLQQASAEEWTAATAPIKVLVTRVSDYPGSLDRYVIIAGSKSGIKELTADTFRGKKIAYSPGANNYLVFLAALKSLNLKPDDVHWIELDTTANSLALLNNSIDLVSGSIDLYGTAIEDGAKVVATSAKMGVPLLSGVLANTTALNDPAKGAAIADFISRYVKYEDWFNTHPVEAKAAYVDGRHFTESQAENAWKYSRVLVNPVNADALKGAEQVSSLLYDAGKFTKKLNVSAIFDDRLSPAVGKTLSDLNFTANLDASIKAHGK